MTYSINNAVCAYPIVEGYKHMLRRLDGPNSSLIWDEGCVKRPMCGREHEDDAFVEAVRWFLTEHSPAKKTVDTIEEGLENRGCALVSTKPVTIDCSARGANPERTR